MLDFGVLLVRVGVGVLEGDALCHSRRDRLGDHLAHPVGVLPRDITEVVVESLEDVRQPVQLGLGAMTASAHRNRLHLGTLIAQQDLLDRPLLPARVGVVQYGGQEGLDQGQRAPSSTQTVYLVVLTNIPVGPTKQVSVLVQLILEERLP